MYMAIELHFASGNEVQLTHTKVRDQRGIWYRTVRGHTEGAYKGHGTFQWTRAVRALSLLLVEYCMSGSVRLEGTNGSLASSLDYALSKRPIWLLDVFGVDSAGVPSARRLFKVTNPNRKRPGPVAIRVDEHVLPSGNIRIFLDRVPIETTSELEPLARTLKVNESGGGNVSLRPVPAAAVTCAA